MRGRPVSLRDVAFTLLLCLVAFLCLDRLEAQRDGALQERDQARAEVDGLREAARITGELLAKAAANDLKHTKELADARTQNADLRIAVDAGDQRLFVKANCPTGLPARAGAGGVADAGAAELAADARSDYFTLRDQLALSRQMILGLQDHVRQICRR